MAEYEKVLIRIESGLTSEEIQEWIELILTHSSISTPFENENLKVIEADPEDDKFIECALSCQANYIISGDKHLLNLKNYEGIEIVSPAEFFKRNSDLFSTPQKKEV